MTQEDKELLLKDLCARLPYGVKCCDFCYNDDDDIVNTIETLECIYPFIMKYKYKDIDTKHAIGRIKPYLRSMDDMTEEERHEYNTIAMHTIVTSKGFVHFEATDLIDWLNARHFDYRGLIERGLALEATDGMYNLKEK